MNRAAAVFLLLPVFAACTLTSAVPPRPWDHVVMVVLENCSASEVRDLPFLQTLRLSGREFTASVGVARPSQPNYLALFSGSTQGVSDNENHTLSSANLTTRFLSAGLPMISWAQSLPSPRFGGDAYPYLRKHNPAASFSSVPDSTILPLSAFPTDFDALPRLSLVVPDMAHDMHDDAPAHSDAWLQGAFSAYAAWARGHRSLLIVTFDEPSTGGGVEVATTPIYTVFVGHGIPVSTSASPLNHYGLLKYLLDCYGLAPLGLDAQQQPLDDGR